MSTYLALTIGPIYKTLNNARSTKGIWAASYMFSHLIHKIMDGFIQKTKSKREFLIPYIEYKSGSETHINWEYSQAKGVGLLPDQIIIQSLPGDFEIMEDAISDVIKAFAKSTTNDLKSYFTKYGSQSAQKRKNGYSTDTVEGLEQKVESFLKNYFQIYFLEIENVDKNPVLDIKDILDNLELQSKIPNDETFPFIQDMLENCYYNSLIRQEFSLENRGFPSTIEIATKQFQLLNEKSYNNLVKRILDQNNTDSDDSQEKFIEFLKKSPFKESCPFKQYHKYIAIVQADGDSIGFLIKQIFNIKKGEEAINIFNIFSKQFIQFSKASVKLINEYGGTNIYAGGDDLLFFAPVMTADGSNPKSSSIKHIFGLINQIDNCFKLFISECPELKDLVDECIKKNKRPAMSYGISISYYKFPMNEALSNAYDLLFHVAKKTRNAIAFRVMKHSGQYFGTSFSKTNGTYSSFIKLIETHLIDESYLTSVMYKLEEQKVVLKEIYAFMPNNDEDTPDNRLLQLFKNNFDEKIHQTDDKQLFLKSVRHLVRVVFNEEIDIDSRMHKIYSSLRFVNFLKADDK